MYVIDEFLPFSRSKRPKNRLGREDGVVLDRVQGILRSTKRCPEAFTCRVARIVKRLAELNLGPIFLRCGERGCFERKTSEATHCRAEIREDQFLNGVNPEDIQGR